MTKKDLLLSIGITVSEDNGHPCIYLRKKIRDPKLIRLIVSGAYHDRPIYCLPKFQDKLTGIGALVEKGILRYEKETEQYYFNI